MPQPTCSTTCAVSLSASAATITGLRDGEDPVEPARDDVAREARRETDDVHVGGGKRLRQHAARLVVEELDLVDFEQLGKRDELRVPRAHADDHDPQVVEIAQERRGADERVEILRVADVAASA